MERTSGSVRAHRFNATLAHNDGVPFVALAQREGVSRSYFTRLVRLSYLAPVITQAINGRQPPDLTAEKLLAHSRLPLAWNDQRIAQISQIIEEYFMGLSLARYLEIAVDVHGPDRRINDPAVPVPGILGMIFHLTKARCT